MKKKNYLYLLAIMMVFVLSVGMTSCGGDDGDDEEKESKELLIGTWHMDEIRIDDAHSWTENTTTFKSDGTLERIEYLTQGNGVKYSYKKGGQYSYNANTGVLSAVYKDNDSGESWSQSYNVIEITKNKLVLTGVSTGNGLSFTFFYERVK